MILDRETVITGSFNFTSAAEEKNAENLLVIKSTDLVRLYVDNWVKHKGHSDVLPDEILRRSWRLSECLKGL